jgi:hypothetical protein
LAFYTSVSRLKQQMTPIILVSLDVFASWLKATQPLTTTRITEQISKRTK